MKRTHMSVGVYEPGYRPIAGRRTREKHRTKCDSVCDNTKATTDAARVTCQLCLKRLPDEMLRREGLRTIAHDRKQQ